MPKKKKLPKKRYALNPHSNPIRRRDLIDYDYIDKLTEAEKDWLNQFTEEFVGANFKNAKIHSKKYKQSCEHANNARNRDIYTLQKAKGMLYGSDTIEALAGSLSSDPEDALIELIDLDMSNKNGQSDQ